MKILLDTHTLIWFVENAPQLPTKTKDLIADEGTERIVSIVSLWEIAIKHSLGRLALSLPLDEFIATHLPADKVTLLPITVLHILTFAQMPWHHRDPFDRILVAQAITEALPIISVDAALDAYGVQRLWD
jgi:PIN domain nuclease of toxin-antitoxin system